MDNSVIHCNARQSLWSSLILFKTKIYGPVIFVLEKINKTFCNLKNELHHISNSFDYQTCIKYRNVLNTWKNILQNMSASSIELHLDNIIIIKVINCRLWIKLISWSWYFQLLTIYAYTWCKQNDIKTATMVRDIHTYILWSISFSITVSCWLHKVDYTAYEIWSGNGFIWASTHPQLIFDA